MLNQPHEPQGCGNFNRKQPKTENQTRIHVFEKVKSKEYKKINKFFKSNTKWYFNVGQKLVKITNLKLELLQRKIKRW